MWDVKLSIGGGIKKCTEKIHASQAVTRLNVRKFCSGSQCIVLLSMYETSETSSCCVKLNLWLLLTSSLRCLWYFWQSAHPLFCNINRKILTPSETRGVCAWCNLLLEQHVNNDCKICKRCHTKSSINLEMLENTKRLLIPTELSAESLCDLQCSYKEHCKSVKVWDHFENLRYFHVILQNNRKVLWVRKTRPYDMQNEACVY